MRRVRLDKLLSENGLSRSQAGAYVRAGRVRVDGQVADNPALILDADDARVLLDGRALRTDQHLHLMLNKPAGYVTALEDARERTVFDLLPASLRRHDLSPVGRLDKDVTGLLLLTTDGQLLHRLISPRWAQEKRYRALVEGTPTTEDVRSCAEGLPLHDFRAKPARLTVLEAGERALCEIVLSEGRYHQVKRMFAALGHPVLALSRRAEAGVALDPALSEGDCRALTRAEVDCLYASTGLS